MKLTNTAISEPMSPSAEINFMARSVVTTAITDDTVKRLKAWNKSNCLIDDSMTIQIYAFKRKSLLLIFHF